MNFRGGKPSTHTVRPILIENGDFFCGNLRLESRHKTGSARCPATYGAASPQTILRVWLWQFQNWPLVGPGARAPAWTIFFTQWGRPTSRSSPLAL